MRRAAAALLLAACGGGGAADARVLVDAGPARCDTVTQDCTAAAAPKCTLVQIGSSGVPRCVTAFGYVAVGQACVRAIDIGRDDCAPGLYCSGLGFPVVSGKPPMRVCRRFCRDACGAGEACVKLSDEAPPDGICVPTGCALFASSCPSGMACDAVEITVGGKYTGVCRSPGTGEPGGQCSDVDCVSAAHCQRGATAGTATCRLLCDDAHACPAGGTCEKLDGMPGGGGLCR